MVQLVFHMQELFLVEVGRCVQKQEEEGPIFLTSLTWKRVYVESFDMSVDGR